ncbi:MAG: hypothetical protein ABH813_00785 [Patescibacteria group bacterium]
MANSQEAEIQERVLSQLQNDWLEAFFGAFHKDDEEGMKNAINHLYELDQKHNTHELDKLLNWFENMDLLRGTPIEQELYRIKALYDIKKEGGS